MCLYLFVCLLACFLGPQPWPMEFPRLEFKLELQMPPYTRDTAMPDPSHVCDLHHSSWQCQIFNPLSEARDQTWVLMGSSGSLLLSHKWNSRIPYCNIRRQITTTTKPTYPVPYTPIIKCSQPWKTHGLISHTSKEKLYWIFRTTNLQTTFYDCCCVIPWG